MRQLLGMRRKRRNRAQWAALLEKQEKSGEEIQRFCDGHDCGTASFYQWRAKLQNSSQRFVAVEVLRPRSEPTVVQQPSARLKVGDTELSFEASADPRWVAEVLLAAAGC